MTVYLRSSDSPRIALKIFGMSIFVRRSVGTYSFIQNLYSNRLQFVYFAYINLQTKWSVCVRVCLSASRRDVCTVSPVSHSPADALFTSNGGFWLYKAEAQAVGSTAYDVIYIRLRPRHVGQPSIPSTATAACRLPLVYLVRVAGAGDLLMECKRQMTGLLMESRQAG